MSRKSGWVLVVVASFLSQPVRGEPKVDAKAPRVDRYGDPLPEGAIARLGTVRLRHRGEAWCVLFSPDGKLLISTGPLSSQYGQESAVRVWDATSGKLIRSFGQQLRGYYSLALSPDGRTLASRGSDATIRLWDITTGRAVRECQVDDPENPDVIGFSPDGKKLISGGSVMLQWEVATGKKLQRPAAFHGIPVCFSANGKFLATAGISDSAIRIYAFETGKLIRQIRGAAGGFRSSALSANGKSLVIGDEDGRIHLWDVHSGKEVRQFNGHQEEVCAVAISPDGDGATLASGAKDKPVRLWDVATGKERHRLTGHRGAVYAVAFSPDGKTLASGSFDQWVKLWDVASGKERPSFRGHQNCVCSVTFSADGRRLISGGADEAVHLSNPNTGEELRQTHGHREWINCVASSPDGKTIASGSWDARIHLWDAATGKQLRAILGHRRDIKSVAFSPDSKTLASTSGDSTIRLWDMATCRELRTIRGNGEWRWVTSIAFSPDGKSLVTGSDEIDKPLIRLWDVTTGKEIGRIATKDDTESVAFSPDGKTLASGENRSNPIIRLWDVATRKELCRFQGHEWEVNSVAYSPDGRLLASGSADETVRIWEVISGQELRQFKGHEGEVTSVAFSPDGKMIASASRDYTVLTWDVTGLLDDGRSSNRRLTVNEIGAMWHYLASKSASKAHRATWLLASCPREVVPFLKERLPPVPHVKPEWIARVIADLDSGEFAVREKASQQLERLDELAVLALRRTLERKPSLEVQRRVRDLLDKIEAPIPPPERLRQVRAVAALEYTGTPEARQLLSGLAKGAPEARLTQEAKASLERLSKRPAEKR